MPLGHLASPPEFFRWAGRQKLGLHDFTCRGAVSLRTTTRQFHRSAPNCSSNTMARLARGRARTPVQLWRRQCLREASPPPLSAESPALAGAAAALRQQLLPPLSPGRPLQRCLGNCCHLGDEECGQPDPPCGLKTQKKPWQVTRPRAKMTSVMKWYVRYARYL